MLILNLIFVHTYKKTWFFIFSTAILRYLCDSRNLADHWYPSDLKKRAKIDEYLSWHHTNLRMGAAMHFRTLVSKSLCVTSGYINCISFSNILCFELHIKYFLALWELLMLS